MEMTEKAGLPEGKINLLDYFAGKVLPLLVQQDVNTHGLTEEEKLQLEKQSVKKAYHYADLMMKERKKSESPYTKHKRL